MTELLALPADTAGLVPHEGRMRMVDQLLSLGEESAVVSACLPADGLLVASSDGGLESVIYAELVAQAYAAYRGYELKALGLAPRAGYLVAIRQLDVLGRARAGDPLTISVRTVGVLEGFAVIAGDVCHGEEILATAKLKVYIPEGDLV